MKKAVVFVFIVFLVQGIGFAQEIVTRTITSKLIGSTKDKYIDSLLIALSREKEDISKVNTLIKLGYEYSYFLNKNDSIPLFYLKQGISIAQKINYKKGEADCYGSIGLIYDAKSNWNLALENRLNKLKLEREIDDKKRIIKTYSDIGNNYNNMANYDKALEMYFASLKIRQQLGDKKSIAECYGNIAMVYGNKQNTPKQLANYLSAQKIYNDIGDENGIADTESKLAEIYTNEENYNKALEIYLAKLKIYKERGDKIYPGLCSSIGIVYMYSKNYDKAIEYLITSVKMAEESGDKWSAAETYNNIGVNYAEKHDYDKALENYFSALQMQIELGNKSMTASVYNNIGALYTDGKNDYEKAIANYSAARKIYEEMNDNIGLARSFNNFGRVYLKQNKTKEAKEQSLLCLKMAKELGSNWYIRESYQHIAKCDSALSDWKGAYEYHKLYKEFNDSIDNVESIRKTAEMSSKYESDKKESEINLLQKEKEAKELEAKKKEQENIILTTVSELQKSRLLNQESEISEQNLLTEKQKKDLEVLEQGKQIQELSIKNKEQELKQNKTETEKQKQQKNYFLIGFLLVLVFSGFVFRSLRIRNKQNKIITEQKGVVEKQKHLVEVKNHEITQSIQYALRIQTAILPPQKIVKQYLENSFILYKPKDIVAGDFYWMEAVQLDNMPSSQLANETNGNSRHQQIGTLSHCQIILFAACDCTGHGVPGAMVSVVCHNALNRAVREFGLTKPSEILDKTAEIVIENFSKSEENIKDGMDISLACLSPTLSEGEGAGTYTLQWAGANNPLWIVRNFSSPSGRSGGAPELEEIKADKQPIGMNEDSKPFTNHTIALNSGDTIYLFTDGFADQFGGETGEKKLTRKRFKEVLLSIQHLSLTEQGIQLDKFITEYRKEVEQIDDILVMGVRV